MIQRQQTLWLILSAISAFLSFKLPFYSGTRLESNLTKAAELEGGSSFLLLVLTGAALILAAVTIFIFKDRKLQLKLAYVGIAISVLLIAMYFVEIRNFATGTIALSCLFVFAILAGFIMAARGIWKDEKLVKSLDKLR